MNTRSKTLKTLQAFIEDGNHQSGALVDDLLTEILLRLPVTSILRFKSVSKHWRWLLTHRDFTLRYDSLSKTPGLFACGAYIPLDAENRSTPPFRSLDFCSDPRGIKIVQSCNGLLLCCSDRGSRGARKYYVFNPTTKQFAIVPPVPEGKNVCKDICFMGLAFHKKDCVHYKLVCIRALEPYGGYLYQLYQIQIYSSNIGEWKVSVEAFTRKPCFFLNGVYWNGAIHILQEFYLTHFYFKIDVEQLQTLPLPAEMTRSAAFVKYFGESRGHLHLIVGNSYYTNTLNMNVYEMLRDYSGWFVKFQVQLDEIPVAFPEMVRNGSYYFNVIDVVRGEKEEDTFLVLKVLRKIIKYNVYDKSFKQIFSLGRGVSFGWGETHHHVATVSAF